MTVGLTGGTGTGKSLVSEFFEKKGFLTLDLDKVTREIYKKDSLCLKEITDLFGKEYLLPSGELDRKKLGERVFSDKDELKKLENAVFKYINSYVSDFIKKNKGKNILLDAPTLFEAGTDKKCDVTIGVVANKDIRKERIIKRDKISPDMAQKRIDAQRENEFFIKRCDYIIENSKEISDLEKETENIIGRVINDFSS